MNALKSQALRAAEIRNAYYALTGDDYRRAMQVGASSRGNWLVYGTARLPVVRASFVRVPGGYEWTLREDGKVRAQGWTAGSRRDAECAVYEQRMEMGL